MNGIINVLKPAGMTSFDVVGYLRKITGQKKIGHTGTLDPSAVGVLPICLGNATRAIEFMIDKDKVYRAELTLGIATDTQDSSGKAVFLGAVRAGNEGIIDVVNSFKGEIDQLPPMYSAIKIGGKKLYELARHGETIERQPRKVNIFDINTVKIWDEKIAFSQDECYEEYYVKKVLFDVHCSKGTYIRTLCNDIGERLGCGGHMSFLVRVRAGKYSLKRAMTLEEIKEFSDNNTLEQRLIPVESVFEDYSSITLKDEDLLKYNNGITIKIISDSQDKMSINRVYDIHGNFIGVGEITLSGHTAYLKTKKFFRI